MGCDIHMFLEARPKRTLIQKLIGVSTKFSHKGKVSLNKYFVEYNEEPEFIVEREDSVYTGGRNYNLFCALAGVRSFEFFGKPKSVSKPKGIPHDLSDFVMAEIERYGSDGHSHSYLSVEELQAFDWSDYGKTCDRFRDEVIPKMVSLRYSNEEVRIVFFFDN